MNIQDYIIETPLAEVFYKGESQGFHNEYTVRNILVQVKNKKLENHFEFVYKDKKSCIAEEDGYAYVKPNFNKGFFDLSYTQALTLMD